MLWTTPTLIEVCVGLEINGYLPAESDSYVRGAQKLGISLNRVCQMGAQGRLNCVFPAFAFRRKETVSAAMRMRGDSNRAPD